MSMNYIDMILNLIMKNGLFSIFLIKKWFEINF